MGRMRIVGGQTLISRVLERAGIRGVEPKGGHTTLEYPTAEVTTKQAEKVFKEGQDIGMKGYQGDEPTSKLDTEAEDTMLVPPMAGG